MGRVSHGLIGAKVKEGAWVGEGSWSRTGLVGGGAGGLDAGLGRGQVGARLADTGEVGGGAVGGREALGRAGELEKGVRQGFVVQSPARLV